MIAPGLTLVRLADIPDPGAKVVDIDGASLIVTRRGDAVSAFVNRCAHAEYRLEYPDGRLIVQEGRYVVCHAHGASYALDTGACAGGPCNRTGLTRISVEILDGTVRSA